MDEKLFNPDAPSAPDPYKEIARLTHERDDALGCLRNSGQCVERLNKIGLELRSKLDTARRALEQIILDIDDIARAALCDTSTGDGVADK